MVKLTIEGKEHQYEDGISYEIIAREFQPDYSDRIALVTMNGKIRELTKKTDTDGVLNFITMKDNIAHKTYVRTAIMIMLKAVRDCIGADSTNHVKIEFTIGPGYYCSFNDGLKVSKDQIDDIKDKMKSLIEADLPITKKSYPKDEAIALFKRLGMNDKVEVFKYRRSSAINIYCLGDYYDYFYGYMMPFTGYVDLFDLIPYENGMMLVLPANGRPDVLPEFQPREHLFNSLMGTNNWNLQFGIDNVGDLNDAVCSGRIKDLIFVQEALQERRIGEIAKMISDRDKVKFVMIAGPSSSGKTTFSHRLSIQLQTYGLTPHYVGLDNYYLDHDKTPVDEEGNPDYECLEALDVERFNEDMTGLLGGEEIELPKFNFKTGKREHKGTKTKLGKGDILVIEGIHGLNEKMSYTLPTESKFKIYISGLTTLSIDDHNRIPTTDGRLIRRIVRDARTRGSSAKRTIAMWASVRNGEEKNIFPYQEDADVMFNSAMFYELAVLKQYAEPLLFNISKDEPEYYEAKRLLKFLEYFLSVPGDILPTNSLCREFIGGSCFNVDG
jgi:uridine kinase